MLLKTQNLITRHNEAMAHLVEVRRKHNAIKQSAFGVQADLEAARREVRAAQADYRASLGTTGEESARERVLAAEHSAEDAERAFNHLGEFAKARPDRPQRFKSEEKEYTLARDRVTDLRRLAYREIARELLKDADLGPVNRQKY